MQCFQFPFFYLGAPPCVPSIWWLFWIFASFVGPHSLLCVLGSTPLIFHHNCPFLSPKHHYYMFSLPLMIQYSMSYIPRYSLQFHTLFSKFVHSSWYIHLDLVMVPLTIPSLAFPHVHLTMTLLNLLVIVILVGMFVRLGPLVEMGFHTHLEILDTILQLFLIEFVILNGWYPIMVYL